MDLVLFLETIKKISTTTVSVIRLVDYFAKNDPIHVKERLARSLEMMSEYMHEKHQSKDPGDAWRNDWFAENQVSNRLYCPCTAIGNLDHSLNQLKFGQYCKFQAALLKGNVVSCSDME